MKRLGLYRKRMYAWKYTVLGGRGVTKAIKKAFYNAFDCIFMVTESHVKESIDNGIIMPDRVKYMRWGEDCTYVDRVKGCESNACYFISTGKAYRDYKTLCKAFEQVKGAKLRIFTFRHWGNYDYESYLSTIRNPNIEVIYSDMIEKDSKEHIMQFFYSQMKSTCCSLAICEDVDFGVGYTQILDTMTCSIPIIATWNRYNPIDIDKMNIGVTVNPYDVEGLRVAMQSMVDDAEHAKAMGEKGRRLVETEYNIDLVAT